MNTQDRSEDREVSRLLRRIDPVTRKHHPGRPPMTDILRTHGFLRTHDFGEQRACPRPKSTAANCS